MVVRKPPYKRWWLDFQGSANNRLRMFFILLLDGAQPQGRFVQDYDHHHHSYLKNHLENTGREGF